MKIVDGSAIEISVTGVLMRTIEALAIRTSTVEGLAD